jgi:isoleucyl-tRNA synthetase
MLLGSMHENAHLTPLTTLDKVALVQLDKAMMGVLESWETYEFHTGVAITNRWVNSDLSALYLEGAKDRLYCGDGGSVLYHIFNGFMQMLAPITPLLVEEAWEHRPEWMKRDEYVFNIHSSQRFGRHKLTHHTFQIYTLPFPPNPRSPNAIRVTPF